MSQCAFRYEDLSTEINWPLFCLLIHKLTPAVEAGCVTAAWHDSNLFFSPTCSDRPWSRGSHVPQADVRGAASHLPSDPWPHRVRRYRCRRGFLQVLCQRHHRAHQDWQVRLQEEEEVCPVDLLCNALTHNILHGAHCEQRSRCIITSLYPSASAPSRTQALGSYQVCQLSRHSQSVLHSWPFEIWTLTFYKLILTPCSCLSTWEFILTAHDTEDVLLSGGWIS